MDANQVLMLLTIVLHCDGNKLTDKLVQRLAQRQNDNPKNFKIMRRFGLPGDPSVIIGAPTYPYHLPPAQPILPGHTLIRPALGMLKSAVKFPHRDQENGSGVYGHFENMGIKFDGKQERVLYTGFRRMLPETEYGQTKRNHIPYTYRRRHLEIQPHKHKKKQKLNNRMVGLNKVLTIYPAEITNRYRQLKDKSFQPKSSKQLKKSSKKLKKSSKKLKKSSKKLKMSLRALKDQNSEDTVLGQIILIKNEEKADLLDIFSFIRSLRRDEDDENSSEEDSHETHSSDEKSHQSNPKYYVPGTADFGDFGIIDSDPETAGAVNKTATFWMTKEERLQSHKDKSRSSRPHRAGPRRTRGY